MKKLLEKFKDELFAEKFECVNCSEEVLKENKYHLCDDCLESIDFINIGCRKCGDRVNEYTFYCDNCKQTEHNFDRVICCSKFDGVAKHMIYKLKYGEAKYLARVMAIFMAEKFESVCREKIDLIIPVPLSRERMKERGYNQAELIAKHLSKLLNIEIHNSVLRVKDTPTQTHLSRDERRENLLGAFDISDKEILKGKTILLVDDVCTTGATMDEISKLLRKCKVKAIYGLTFCHA